METIKTVGGILLFVLLYCLNFMLIIGTIVGLFQFIGWIQK